VSPKTDNFRYNHNTTSSQMATNLFDNQKNLKDLVSSQQSQQPQPQPQHFLHSKSSITDEDLAKIAYYVNWQQQPSFKKRQQFLEDLLDEMGDDDD